VAASLARTMHALCHADGRDSVVLVAYFSREKLFADVPFFEVGGTDTLLRLYTT
jgi:hypothetical protein